jgi:hypothetical protein
MPGPQNSPDNGESQDPPSQDSYYSDAEEPPTAPINVSLDRLSQEKSKESSKDDNAQKKSEHNTPTIATQASHEELPTAPIGVELDRRSQENSQKQRRKDELEGNVLDEDKLARRSQEDSQKQRGKDDNTRMNLRTLAKAISKPNTDNEPQSPVSPPPRGYENNGKDSYPPKEEIIQLAQLLENLSMEQKKQIFAIAKGNDPQSSLDRGGTTPKDNTILPKMSGARRGGGSPVREKNPGPGSDNAGSEAGTDWDEDEYLTNPYGYEPPLPHDATWGWAAGYWWFMAKDPETRLQTEDWARVEGMLGDTGYTVITMNPRPTGRGKLSKPGRRGYRVSNRVIPIDLAVLPLLRRGTKEQIKNYGKGGVGPQPAVPVYAAYSLNEAMEP